MSARPGQSRGVRLLLWAAALGYATFAAAAGWRLARLAYGTEPSGDADGVILQSLAAFVMAGVGATAITALTRMRRADGAVLPPIVSWPARLFVLVPLVGRAWGGDLWMSTLSLDPALRAGRPTWRALTALVVVIAAVRAVEATIWGASVLGGDEWSGRTLPGPALALVLSAACCGVWLLGHRGPRSEALRSAARVGAIVLSMLALGVSATYLFETSRAFLGAVDFRSEQVLRKAATVGLGSDLAVAAAFALLRTGDSGADPPDRW